MVKTAWHAALLAGEEKLKGTLYEKTVDRDNVDRVTADWLQ